ncbi:hypothetical protein [Streptomyces sp. NPDC088812]
MTRSDESRTARVRLPQLRLDELLGELQARLDGLVLPKLPRSDK